MRLLMLKVASSSLNKVLLSPSESSQDLDWTLKERAAVWQDKRDETVNAQGCFIKSHQTAALSFRVQSRSCSAMSQQQQQIQQQQQQIQQQQQQCKTIKT